jgi:flagellar hook-associated protein 1 FlgK
MSIGLSALSANQTALDVTGQNIANVNTPGYHRQLPVFVDRTYAGPEGLQIGSGVQVTDIRHIRSQLLETELTQNQSQTSDTTAQLDAARQIEAFLNPTNGSLSSAMDTFFSNLQQLSTTPEDAALRNVAIQSGMELANQFNTQAGQLDQLKAGLDHQLAQTVSEVNNLASQIAGLNTSIARAECQGATANDLRDQRDQLINQLAQDVDVRTIERGSQTTVIAGEVPLVIGDTSTPLTYTTDSSGNGIVTAAGGTTPLAITGGQIAGLLQIHNQSLPNYRSRLDTLANQLAQQVDSVQATGLGPNGPFTFVSGTRGGSSTVLPLAQANLAFPPRQARFSSV